jgi:Spy/CpxP family protein refolding chaperone
MHPVIATAILAALTPLASSSLQSQDKKDTPIAKPALPPNFDKLELTAEQKIAISKIQAQCAEKIAKLRAEERDEMMQILTPGQKTKLKELTSDTSKTDSKGKK